jgi:hypothetical protein
LSQAAVLKNAAENAKTGSFNEPVLPGAKKTTGLQGWFDKHRLAAVLSNLAVYALVAGGIFGWIEVMERPPLRKTNERWKVRAWARRTSSLPRFTFCRWRFVGCVRFASLGVGLALLVVRG